MNEHYYDAMFDLNQRYGGSLYSKNYHIFNSGPVITPTLTGITLKGDRRPKKFRKKERNRPGMSR